MCQDSGLPIDWSNFLLGLADFEINDAFFFKTMHGLFGAFVLMNWNKR